MPYKSRTKRIAVGAPHGRQTGVANNPLISVARRWIEDTHKLYFQKNLNYIAYTVPRLVPQLRLVLHMYCNGPLHESFWDPDPTASLMKNREASVKLELFCSMLEVLQLIHALLIHWSLDRIQP